MWQKLAILSTTKFLKYIMKYTDLGFEFEKKKKKKTLNLLLQYPSTFLRMSPKLYFYDSVNFCKLLERKC